MSRFTDVENLSLRQLVMAYRAKRSHEGLATKQIAAELGISRVYLRRISVGQVSFSFPTGLRILRALRISLSDFEKAMEAA